jgi:1-acyl-sn-glycerol-3-phosphate acyltransferase
MVGLSVPRRLTFIAKTELFTNRFNRAALAFFGGLPLNRQRPLESRATLSRAAQLLVAGRGVVVFPEGTYYPDRVGPGHKGIVRFLMRRTTAPFVPMGIRYSKSLPTGSLHVHIRIGSALYPDGDQVAVDDFVNRIMKRVAVLSGLTG